MGWIPWGISGKPNGIQQRITNKGVNIKLYLPTIYYFIFLRSWLSSSGISLQTHMHLEVWWKREVAVDNAIVFVIIQYSLQEDICQPFTTSFFFDHDYYLLKAFLCRHTYMHLHVWWKREVAVDNAIVFVIIQYSLQEVIINSFIIEKLSLIN